MKAALDLARNETEPIGSADLAAELQQTIVNVAIPSAVAANLSDSSAPPYRPEVLVAISSRPRRQRVGPVHSL